MQPLNCSSTLEVLKEDMHACSGATLHMFYSAKRVEDEVIVLRSTQTTFQTAIARPSRSAP